MELVPHVAANGFHYRSSLLSRKASRPQYTLCKTDDSFFPALTIEHSPELAQKEADELAEMISEMAKRLSA